MPASRTSIAGWTNFYHVLKDEVLRRGTVRRLLTTLDGTLNALLDFQKQLRGQSTTIKQAANSLKAKLGELDVWFDGFVRGIPGRIDAETVQFLQPLWNGRSQEDACW